MAGKFRGKTTWDPILILSQIISIQLLSYTSLTILIFIATSCSGYSPSIEFIFDHAVSKNPIKNSSDMMGLGTAKLIIIAHLGNSIVGAYLVKIFVERYKSCLDFSITYHIIHFILVWFYSKGIPDTFTWYAINIISACIMCVMAEFLCRREEMQNIPITAIV